MMSPLKLTPCDLPPSRGPERGINMKAIRDFVASGEDCVRVDGSGSNPRNLQIALCAVVGRLGYKDRVCVSKRGECVYLVKRGVA